MEMMTKPVEMSRVTRKLTHQFVLDEDYNVPDSKNDIQKIVFGEGTARVDEIKKVENYFRVQGCMEFRVLYVAEGFECAYEYLDGKLPFTEMIYADKSNDDKLEIKNIHVEVHASAVHSRKVRIKAMVELSLESEEELREEFPIDADCNCQLFKKWMPLEILKLQVSKKDMYRIKEEIALPGTKESIGRILWSDVTNRKMETRLGVDELRLEGELLVFCFYESPEGKIDWIEQSIPYQGHIECFDVDESMYHYVKADLDEVHIEVGADEDGEMRLIGVEGTLQLYIAIYDEEKIEVLEDVYSLEKNCILETKEVEYEKLIVQNRSKCKVMERLSVPELNKEVLQICHSSGALRVERMEKCSDGVLVEGVMLISFLYVKADDRTPYDIWKGVVPFSHLIECGETNADFQYHIASILEQLSVTLQGGDEIEVKAVLSFHGFFKSKEKREIIQNVHINALDAEEIEKRPSIVGYTVKKGDTLWSLAKRYCTSVDAICEVNEMSEETLREGDRLLIFKENMSIL